MAFRPQCDAPLGKRLDHPVAAHSCPVVVGEGEVQNAKMPVAVVEQMPDGVGGPRAFGR